MQEISERSPDQWVDSFRDFAQGLTGIESVSKIDPNVISELIARIAQTDGSVPPDIAKQAARRAGVTPDELVNALSAVILFFGELPSDLSISEGISGLAKKGLVPVNQAQEITRVLDAVNSGGAARQASRKMKEYGEGEASLSEAAPRLKGFWTRVLSVARFENGSEENLQKYKPKLERIDNIVLLQIDANAYGRTQNFAVAMTPKELSSFIRKLQMTEVELASMTKATENIHGK